MTDEFPKRRIAAGPTYDVATSYLTSHKHLDDGDTLDPRYFASVAILGYALGKPLSEVREHGRRALLAFRNVLRMRPPLEHFQKPISPGSWIDYSIGASSVGLEYMYWALLLREGELAREIAENTWDPPSMGRTRIFPAYRVAYGLRDLILGRQSQALLELERLPASASKYLHQQARAIAALARAVRSEVTPAIVELSAATRKAMGREYLQQNKIFALPGAALASYALDHGLMTRDELPRHVDTFPLELV